MNVFIKVLPRIFEVLNTLKTEHSNQSLTYFQKIETFRISKDGINVKERFLV